MPCDQGGASGQCQHRHRVLIQRERARRHGREPSTRALAILDRVGEKECMPPRRWACTQSRGLRSPSLLRRGDPRLQGDGRRRVNGRDQDAGGLTGKRGDVAGRGA